MEKYQKILQSGEVFWDRHDILTKGEIRDALSVMRACHRLPNCFWEDICDIHATNYSSIYGLTKRFIDAEYPESVCVIKPTISFMQWIYDGICKAEL